MPPIRPYIGRMPAPLAIVAAVTAGLVAGRKLLGREVTARKNRAIEDTAAETRERIRSHAGEFVARSFRRFAIATAIKLAILVTLWGAHEGALVEPALFKGLVAGALALFLLRDIWVNFPIVRLCVTELSRHGWKPKLALSEAVAARVFSEVLTEAAAQEHSRASQLVLMLAGENRARMHRDIALAVADVARQTTWEDLRPFVFSAIVRIGSLALLYSACVWWLLSH